MAQRTSRFVGNPITFAVAFAIIVLWAVSGPLLGFSNTWQLVINTTTTIVTFLIVFLIQNTQNRDSEAVHVKLDELLHALKGARQDIIDAEEESVEELDRRKAAYRDVSERARERESEGREQGRGQKSA